MVATGLPDLGRNAASWGRRRGIADRMPIGAMGEFAVRHVAGTAADDKGRQRRLCQ